MHCCHRSRSLPHHCFFLLALHYLPLVTQISSHRTTTILKTEAFTPIPTTSPLSSLSLKSFNSICNCSNQRLCRQYQYQSKRKRLHPKLGNSPNRYRYSYDKSFHTMAKSRKEGEEEAETFPSNNNNYGGENMKQTLEILNTKQSSSSSLTSIFTSILLKYLWTILTKLSTRKIIRLLSKIVPAYSDTVFYFPIQEFDCFTSICKDETKKETSDTKEKKEGLFAITIDDGLCRSSSSSSSSSSYIPQIAHTLSKYNAQATFFICSDYTVHNPTIVQQARTFLREYGEFACHMKNDADAGYYVNMDKNEWEEEFRGEWRKIDWLMNGKGDVWSEEEQSSYEENETKSNDDKNGCNSTVSEENQTIINDENENSKTEIRWFRSPQGLFTSSMQSTLHSLSSSSSPNKPHKNVKYIHVLGDAYCDDWKLSSYDPHFVASTMLQQIQPGSIAIFHMPEEGFREECLDVLDMVLQGAKERNLRGVMLSKLWERRKK